MKKTPIAKFESVIDNAFDKAKAGAELLIENELGQMNKIAESDSAWQWGECAAAIRALPLTSKDSDAEPVAWMAENGVGDVYLRKTEPKDGFNVRPLYLHPPQPCERCAKWEIAAIQHMRDLEEQSKYKQRAYEAVDVERSRAEAAESALAKVREAFDEVERYTRVHYGAWAEGRIKYIRALKEGK